MTRFFKSAAFPILIVVVLAFFAQKLIGSATHPQNYNFGALTEQINSGQVKNLVFDQKDNSVAVTLTSGQKYTTGYPDWYASTLVSDALAHTTRRPPWSCRTSRRTAGCRCSPTSCRS